MGETASCSSIELKGSFGLQHVTQILDVTLAEGSVTFSFLLLLSLSSPILELTCDPPYSLDLFLIHSLSKTERSEIKAVVPRHVHCINNQTESHTPALQVKFNAKPCPAPKQCDTVKCKSKQTRLQLFVNTEF